MIIKWSRCPHCSKTLKVETRGGGPLDSRLGKPTLQTCPNCQGRYSDGKKEWLNMSILEKTYEVILHSFIALTLSPLINLIIAALVVGVILWLFSLISIDLMDYFPYLAIGLGGVFTIISWKGMLDEFRDSIARSKASDKDPILPN